MNLQGVVQIRSMAAIWTARYVAGDDAVLELEPDYGGGELGISLNQARAEWAAKHK